MATAPRGARLPARLRCGDDLRLRGPHSVFCYGTPEEMLHVLADSMCGLGNNNMHVMGQMLVVLNPLNAEEFAKRGWSKTDVRRYLWEHARRPIGQVRACGVVHEQFRKMERAAGRYPLRYDPGPVTHGAYAWAGRSPDAPASRAGRAEKARRPGR